MFFLMLLTLLCIIKKYFDRVKLSLQITTIIYQTFFNILRNSVHEISSVYYILWVTVQCTVHIEPVGNTQKYISYANILNNVYDTDQCSIIHQNKT